jgi:hypothetical protein
LAGVLGRDTEGTFGDDTLGIQVPSDQERRNAAIAGLKAKRDFKAHAAAYVIVNAGLVVIWALSGAGYFWPIWSMFGWGIGLAFNAWAAYVRRPITEDDIRAEMKRGEPPRTTD